MDTATFLQIAERLGVPVAFAIIMVLLLIRFSNQHRDERGEWRQTMEAESVLNRKAIGELRKGLSDLAVSVAMLGGKKPTKRSPRK